MKKEKNPSKMEPQNGIMSPDFLRNLFGIPSPLPGRAGRASWANTAAEGGNGAAGQGNLSGSVLADPHGISLLMTLAVNRGSGPNQVGFVSLQQGKMEVRRKENLMRRTSFGIVIILLLAFPSMTYAGSVQKAEMLRKHNLVDDAKRELIDVIYGNSTSADKATAYYDLGTIAFEESNISAALDTWSQLASQFPDSQQASIVKDRIKELAEVVGETAKSRVDNAIAQSYLRHADFWSEKRSNVYVIDSSWIPNVEAAIKWYDKTIQEFPRSTASRIAYENKLRTILGWEEPGRYGEKHGVRGDYKKYMPQLVATFTAFETEHPDAPSLQAWRYQIAQAYWGGKDWAKTKEWLNLVIEKSGPIDSFYKDLAQRRLQKVEY